MFDDIKRGGRNAREAMIVPTNCHNTVLDEYFTEIGNKFKYKKYYL